MKQLFSILFAAALISMVACKNEKTGDAANATPATSGEAQATLATSAGNSITSTADGTVVPATEESVPTGPTTSIEFAETTFDYGTIKEGEKVTHNYKFTNTGKEPLIISNAKGSCGCTVPEWPREPIAPGKSGDIKVVFDSSGKGSPEGMAQSKRVTLTANTDPVNTYLTIKGNVKGDKKPAAEPAKQ